MILASELGYESRQYAAMDYLHLLVAAGALRTVGEVVRHLERGRIAASLPIRAYRGDMDLTKPRSFMKSVTSSALGARAMQQRPACPSAYEA